MTKGNVTKKEICHLIILFTGIFFYTNGYAHGACARKCYQHNKHRCEMPRDYVTFNFLPVSFPCSPNVLSADDFYNPDMTTGDDDPSIHPDMDIDR